MLFCIPLQNAFSHPDICGAKSSTLSQLYSFVKIPNGFVITTEAYDDFIEHNQLSPTINECLLEYTVNKISSRECSKKIQFVIEKAEISLPVWADINHHAESIQSPLVVRSSSTVEDSHALSFAGLFDSFVDIGHKDLSDTIRKVYASTFNSRLLEYAKKHQITLAKVKMSVLVQEMIINGKYGVGFSFNDQKLQEVSILESILNDPTGVTGGTKIPDTYVVRENKIFKYPVVINQNSLFEFELSELLSLINVVKEKIYPVDIEWGISLGNVYLLQARPLTREVPIPKGTESYAGLPASKGCFSGKVTIWHGDSESADKSREKILVAEEIEIADVEIIKDFGGLVLEISGITAHAAILAREYEIPCVVGANGITKLINENEPLFINGSTGEIEFPERQGFSIKRSYIPVYINPRKLNVVKYSNDVVLIAPQETFSILYHPSLDKSLKVVLPTLQNKYNHPVIDGGVDIWYGYSNILEMATMWSDIRRDFENALDTIDSLSIEKTEKLARELMNKGVNYLRRAQKNLKKIKTEANIKAALLNIYEDSQLAFTYWRLVQYCMLYDYAENVVYKSEAFELQDFVQCFQQGNELVKMGEEVTEFIETVSKKIDKTLRIDCSEYNSVQAIIDAINLS